MPNPTHNLLAAVTDPDHGRRAARELEGRIRNGTTEAERVAVKDQVYQAITQGRPMEDGSYRRPGPRTLAILTRVWTSLVAQDQADLHHIEGQKVTHEHTDSRPRDVQVGELLLKAAAITGRADLRAKAEALLGSAGPAALPAPIVDEAN